MMLMVLWATCTCHDSSDSAPAHGGFADARGPVSLVACVASICYFFEPVLHGLGARLGFSERLGWCGARLVTYFVRAPSGVVTL